MFSRLSILLSPAFRIMMVTLAMFVQVAITSSVAFQNWLQRLIDIGKGRFIYSKFDVVLIKRYWCVSQHNDRNWYRHDSCRNGCCRRYCASNSVPFRWLLTLASLEWVPYSPIPSPTPSFFVRSPFLPFCLVSSFASATLLWTSASRRSSLPCAWSDFSAPHPSSILSSNVSTLLLSLGDPPWSLNSYALLCFDC